MSFGEFLTSIKTKITKCPFKGLCKKAKTNCGSDESCRVSKCCKMRCIIKMILMLLIVYLALFFGLFDSALRKFLVDRHPESVMDAVINLQKIKQEERSKQAESTIPKYAPAIIADSNVPYIGNPNGKHVAIEFFDYNCGHCKNAHETVKSLLLKDGEFKLKLINLPILGESSIVIARASVAVFDIYGVEKFTRFHNALMSKKGSINGSVISSIMNEIGLDAKLIEQKMSDKSVTEAIESNYKISQEIGLTGTPAFIVGDKIQFNISESSFN